MWLCLLKEQEIVQIWPVGHRWPTPGLGFMSPDTDMNITGQQRRSVRHRHSGMQDAGGSKSTSASTVTSSGKF